MAKKNNDKTVSNDVKSTAKVETLSELRKQLILEKIDVATGKTKDTSKLVLLRKSIARFLTKKNEDTNK